MVDYQALSIIFAGLSIAASILYYASVIRNQNKTQQMQLETRQAQIFIDLYKQFNDPEFVKRKRRVANLEFTDYEEFERRYGPKSNSEAYDDHYSVAAFFEGIGILVKRGLIDPELIVEMMSDSVLTFWGKYRDVTYEGRRKHNQPTAWEYVEYLYESVKKIVEEQYGTEVASRYE